MTSQRPVQPRGQRVHKTGQERNCSEDDSENSAAR